MILKKYNENRTGTEFIEMVKNRFKAGQSYELSQINKIRDEIYSLLNIPPIKKKPKDFLSDFFELRDYWKNRQRALFLEYEKFSQLQHFIIKPLIITPFLKNVVLTRNESPDSIYLIFF